MNTALYLLGQVITQLDGDTK